MKKLQTAQSSQSAVPSTHSILGLTAISALIETHGKALVTDAVRSALAELRELLSSIGDAALTETRESAVTLRIENHLAHLVDVSLIPVLNLTGTVLHTNLGRAPLPDEAIQAMIAVAQGASNLEFDLETGRRGDRDHHLESHICRLTGAEAATIVNNNAAAVLLVLNTLALRKQVLVSRGELIEIGGAFRLPDIMARAGCKLCEVGTTNRTHLSDFSNALEPRTAMILKAHTSNYKIQGFVSTVPEKDLAKLSKSADIPFVVDLGSGSLIDISQFGLPSEPTVRKTLADGADLVTFSGDKLLGGPQCGIIAGRKGLIKKIKKNSMKRALRVDKMTVAALSALLNLYNDSKRAVQRIPTLRLLARNEMDIIAQAERLLPIVATPLKDVATVELTACQSQVGSGALPTGALASSGLAIRPLGNKRSKGAALIHLSKAFRELPLPVIGRIHEGAFILDLRCLEDEDGFTQQLSSFGISHL